jgi:tryptophan 2,3-dioxygenase
MMPYYEHQPEWHARLTEALEAPSLYEEFLMHLARRDMPIPKHVMDRDFSTLREDDDEVVEVLRSIYEDIRRQNPSLGSIRDLRSAHGYSE